MTSSNEKACSSDVYLYYTILTLEKGRVKLKINLHQNSCSEYIHRLVMLRCYDLSNVFISKSPSPCFLYNPFLINLIYRLKLVGVAPCVHYSHWQVSISWKFQQVSVTLFSFKLLDLSRILGAHLMAALIHGQECMVYHWYIQYSAYIICFCIYFTGFARIYCAVDTFANAWCGRYVCGCIPPVFTACALRSC